MNKHIFTSLAFCAVLGCSSIYAQSNTTSGNRPEGMQAESVETMTFRQADEVRNQFNLTQKQFEKVSKAYKTYNENLFGSSSSSSRPSGGPGGGMGGPGGGMGGPGGGMGGPGGGMGGPGGGMGGPGGGGQPPQGDFNQGGAPNGGDRQAGPSQEDMEKRQKEMTKQEEKLAKSIKKILTADQYTQWQELRQTQKMPPKPQQGQQNQQ
jgi:hypothetical protein